MRRWVPRRIDLVGAAVLTVVTQLEYWLIASAGRPLAAVAASYAVGTLAVAWHRVAPMSAVVVGVTALAVVPGALHVEPAATLGWMVTVLALMASAGYHARRPVVALAVAFVLLALSILLQKGWVPADVLFSWLLAGGAWLGGRTVAGRTARVRLSEERAAAVEQEAQWRAAAAVAEERLRIAREMHDVVSHGLSVMTLHVGGVRRLLRPDQDRERAALETAEGAGHEAIAELHRMLGVLRGRDTGASDAAPAPGLGRLPELVDAAAAAGPTVELDIDGDVTTLPAGVDLAAFRIVQESLTNVLRHASARRVAVSVRRAGSSVEVRVTDDGIARPRRGTSGHGLAGMRERAAAYGGTVSAGPRSGGGWEVHAVLPVPADMAAPSDDEVPA